jgi:transketolase
MSVEPVVERFTAFGFETQRIDGHDHDALRRALPSAALPSAALPSAALPPEPAQDRPRAIVLQTVPGRGVPEFERHHKVHYLRLEQAAWAEAIAALG